MMDLASGKVKKGELAEFKKAHRQDSWIKD